MLPLGSYLKRIRISLAGLSIAISIELELLFFTLFTAFIGKLSQNLSLELAWVYLVSSLIIVTFLLGRFISRTISIRNIASLIGRKDEKTAEELIVALSLSKKEENNISCFFIDLHKRLLVEKLLKLKMNEIIPFRKFLFSICIILASLVLSFSYLNSKTDLYRKAYFVLFQSYKLDSIPPRIIRLDVPSKIQKGETAMIEAEIVFASEREKGEVLANYTEAGNRSKMVSMKEVSRNKYNIQIGPLFENTDIFIQAGNVKSIKKKIQVSSPINFQDITMEIVSPQYTGIAARSLPLGMIKAYKGSTVIIKGSTTSQVREIYFQFSKKQLQANLLNDDKGFVFRYDLREEDNFQIIAMDTTDNVSASQKFPVTLIKDKSPYVKIGTPEKEILMPTGREILITTEASDDFLITKVSLVYTANGKTSTILLTDKSNQQSIKLDYKWNLSSIQPGDGSEIRYKIVAWDNDNVSGPKQGESETYIIKIPSFSGKLDQLKKEAKRSDINLKSLSDEAKRLTEESVRLAQESAASGKITDDLQNKIKQHLNAWDDLKKRVKALSEDYKQQRLAKKSNDAANNDLLEREREIERLLKKLEENDFMKDLQKEMQRNNPYDMSRKLDDLSKKGEKYKDELQKLEELMKYMRIEEALQRMEKMAGKMHELEEKARTANSSNNASERDQARKDQKDLWKQLKDDMKETSSQTKDTQLKQELGNLNEWNKQNLENSINQENFDMSSSESRQSSLQNLKQQLQDMQKRYNSRQKQQTLKKINTMKTQASFLARELEKAYKENENERRTQSLESIRQGMDKLDNELADIERRSFLVQPGIRDILEKALDKVRDASENSRNNYTQSGKQSSLQAMGNVNTFHEMLGDLAKRTGAQSSSSGFMEAMKEIAQQQASLNSDTKNMRKGMPGGNTLGSLGLRQRMLSSLLMQAMRNQGNSQSKDELGGMVKEMKDISERIAKNDINDRLLERQDNLYVKMLEYSGALRNQEEEEKREAEQPLKIYPAQASTRRDDEKREAERRLLLKLLRGDYPEAYRQLLEQYFRKMEGI
ncbi:MAG: hypothetical protein JXA60_06345 [Candidatus Coatesbacteria bacterium]|nr:hypothetical protein [Candidatus Coatesbacteria bacterium]